MVTIFESCSFVKGNPLGFAFQESELLQILLKQKLQKLKHSESFFSHWKDFLFLTEYR